MADEPDIALPIFAGTDAGKHYRISGLYGTGIPLGGGCVMTAYHVAANVEATKQLMLVGYGVAPLYTSLARVYHSWPDYDLAVLRADALKSPPLNWFPGQLQSMAEVRTMGYAYGLDLQENTVTSRAFLGAVAAVRNFPNLQARPGIYELSFAAPRGLSGSGLFPPYGPLVYGMIVGNHRTEMLVFSDRETIEEAGGERTIVERYEALNLGIAIRSDVILGLPFPDVGTVRDYVRSQGGHVE
jgi:hypothetical protein